MEITIEQNIYPNSGTKEVTCKVTGLPRDGLLYFYKDGAYSVSKLGTCYQFYKINIPFKQLYEYKPIQLDEDTVLDSVNVQQEDWQLLKILNPDVDSETWKIYHVLKDLVDNKVDEDYVMKRVKDVLNRGE